MQSRTHSFTFDTTFNFGVDSVFVNTSNNEGTPFPPVEGNFELLNGTPMLLLDGSNFLLL